ncbi:MAG: twin-arginine translocase subunit TatC [Bacillota bacterium]|nr:twin-arginine translocase subunit TatC [Bacillota bacterium]MDW7684182.1 twin-arginine translocase subunit TatC [Bacillota bacterium]
MGQRINPTTVIDHLEELRKRLIICVASLAVTTIIALIYVELLRSILIRPAGDIQLIFISPPEALMADFRLALIAGIGLALPVLVYQLIAYLLPALEKNEKKLIIPGVFAVVLFFAAGVSFAYYVVFPFAVRFFLTFATESIQPMFTVSNYLSFATNFIFAFGIVFQMPLLFFVLGSLNIVTPAFLRKSRKFALLIIVIASAILTPPDVVSQIMMAIPLMGLYEIGILMVVFSQRKKQVG